MDKREIEKLARLEERVENLIKVSEGHAEHLDLIHLDLRDLHIDVKTAMHGQKKLMAGISAVITTMGGIITFFSSRLL